MLEPGACSVQLCLPVARGQEHHRVLLAAASPLWVGVEAVRSASVCSWGLGNFVLTIPNLTRCPLVAQKHPQCHSGLTKPSIHADDGVNCPWFLIPKASRSGLQVPPSSATPRCVLLSHLAAGVLLFLVGNAHFFCSLSPRKDSHCGLSGCPGSLAGVRGP